MEREGGWVDKKPPTSFTSVSSTNLRISPQNFLTISFNSFFHIAFKAIPSASSKLLNINQDYPSKIVFFSGQIHIVIQLRL